MDFSFFDASYDGVFVLNIENEVIYCNEAAAQLCSSSVRRLTKNKKLNDIIRFKDHDISEVISSWIEVEFHILQSEKKGRVQVINQNFEVEGQELRVFTLHDVTLEETLHRKYQGELEQKEGVIEELRQAQAQLEKYSKNLERMVEERAGQLKAANLMLSAIMDSLGQGFLVFDSTGVCSQIYTKACLDILEKDPAHKKINEVLGLLGPESEQFDNWLKVSFSESLPFDALKDLAPSNYLHSQGKHITLDYFPIRDESEAIVQVVLVATDKTVEFQTHRELERERAYAKMILKAISNRDQFSNFLSSVEETLKPLFEMSTHDEFDKNLAFRILHTLEGEAGAFSVEPLRLSARECQQVLQTEEVNLSRFQLSLKGLMSDFHEFLNQNSSWLNWVHTSGEPRIEISQNLAEEFFTTLRNSSQPHLAWEFEEKILRQPLQKNLAHFEGLAQSIAMKQGKQLLPIKFDCENVQINTKYWEKFLASLVHVFRNAVDHGMEETAERAAILKPEKGQIQVSARRLDGHDEWVRMEISDDGRGIDPQIIKAKAKEKISTIEVDDLSDQQLIQLIFHPGFSSRDEVSEYSGRGVGMDAVDFEVKKMGGRVWVESALGKGTCFVFELPIKSDKSHLAKIA